MNRPADLPPSLSSEASGDAPWHAFSPTEALARLDVTPAGLSEAEAARRRERYGPNALPQEARVQPLRRFLAQFHNPLIYFLLAAAIAALALAHPIDALVILAVVIVNAIVGFVQEGKAEESLNGMGSLISPRAVVQREGRRQSIDVVDLVPGDVVLLEPGDRVPADLRLLRARGLAIEEAALTGESIAAEKQEDAVAPDAPLGDRTSLAFSGTLVAKGQATGVVIATGTATEIGRISGMLQAVPVLVTPLIQQINRFSHQLTFTILGASILLFAFAVLIRGFVWDDALISVVAVAAAAIPEGLPAVITITLAIGVRRMAARNAVIRKLPAVETLGATSVICTDKTGTLTRNEMTVRHVFTASCALEVAGSGYAPQGAITEEGGRDDAAALADAAAILRCGMLCNDARLSENKAEWTVAGDPMEGALLALGMKAGLDPVHLAGEWPRVDEIPFDAAYRYMATLHRGPGGEHVVFVKGAPEAVLALAEPQADPVRWDNLSAKAARLGERLLGFGMVRLPEPRERLRAQDLERLTMLGLMGFIDPPREEARQAIAECRSAGIAVKMITGDHVETARAIARQLDLAYDPVAMAGAELERLSDAELEDVVGRVSVFARASPEHKLRIVRALQARGAIVAMTGDGVNDAPSLKQADVGTAMGLTGTEAAREASQMVLLDDNFASIVAAVHEGRTVYDNLRKVIAWTLPTNGGEAMLMVLAILLGFTLPMTATQILWINLVTTVTLGLVLAFEPPETEVMQRPPRRADASLLSPFLLWRVIFVSILFTVLMLAVFFVAQARGEDIATARTLVVNMLVIAETSYLFNVRYLHMRSLTWRGALGTPAVLLAISGVLLAQLAFTYLPVMHDIFGTRSITLLDGAIIVALGVVLFVVLELEKWAMKHFDWFEELHS
ncbi:HAD-IC family P-type ATPase [Novosphingobium panipatense]|uniref:HAD-IC family P-type ATPase n=1 Tax=Novosphingobium TaxID=165696 RepID=UPI000CDA5278|nr:HAD-IC family P-type ATPase [Novosphingobium sp. HII-3]